ncbi:hypothetical protein ACSBR1_015968 [Camellia fascicularis]
MKKINDKQRKINDKQRKENFFKRNGGFLLKHKLSSSDGSKKIKLFSSKELEKATDHYHEDRILGQGGQGTVYKGMLSDGRIIAVKKSKVVAKGRVEQFINEVVILSQIVHRNIVKLLGCCLETDVPMLIYEFIPNGTLSQHIHDPNEEFPLSWEMRFRIAIEVAGALAYLHYVASIPIYHRDMKSTNILLDDKYKAKVSDFGTSTSIDVDNTHLTTRVQGTFGYFDPEYFRSNQFTDKSDLLLWLTKTSALSYAKPGCLEYCGDVRIPYPFRIGANYYLDEWFSIPCKNSSGNNNGVAPYLIKTNLEVLEISFNGSYLRVKNPVTSPNCPHQQQQTTNVFMPTGINCNHQEAILTDLDNKRITNCSSTWDSINNINISSYAVEISPYVQYLQGYKVNLRSTNNNTQSRGGVQTSCIASVLLFKASSVFTIFPFLEMLIFPRFGFLSVRDRTGGCYWARDRHIVIDEFYMLNRSDYRHGTRGGLSRAQQYPLGRSRIEGKPNPFPNEVANLSSKLCTLLS